MTTPTAKDREQSLPYDSKDAEAILEIAGIRSYTEHSVSVLVERLNDADAQARADERERVAKRMDMFAEIATDDRDGRLARTCYVFAAAQIRVLSDAEGDPE